MQDISDNFIPRALRIASHAQIETIANRFGGKKLYFKSPDMLRACGLSCNAAGAIWEEFAKQTVYVPNLAHYRRRELVRICRAQGIRRSRIAFLLGTRPETISRIK